MKNNRILKYNRDVKINVATVVIAAVFIYSLISLFIMINKDPITIYKVSKSNINNNISLNGLVVREEKIINSNKNGYVCYYVRDGQKIKKGATLCTIDGSGKMKDYIEEGAQSEEILTASDYNNIRTTISLYKSTYRNENFYNTYNFNNNINNKVVEVTNEILMKRVSGTITGLSTITSPYSGTVTYYIDGYENYDINNVSKEAFDKSKYQKQTLKTGDDVTSNSQIIKVLPSENWNIIAPITDEQIERISNRDSVLFKINNSSFEVYMPYTIIEKPDGKYINISLNKYMSNFIAERFVSIEIIKPDDKGLKIPVSSIVEKDTYKIPVRYLSGGGNQTNYNRFNIQVKDNETGEVTIKQVLPTIYMMDDEYCYVDPSVFSNSDVLLDITSNNTIAVSLLEINKLQGVYLANRGTAEFRKVTVLKTVDEFSLIKNDEEIKVYDNIILDASSVSENQIIY